jgi:hypothetical protein
MDEGGREGKGGRWKVGAEMIIIMPIIMKVIKIFF